MEAGDKGMTVSDINEWFRPILITEFLAGGTRLSATTIILGLTM